MVKVGDFVWARTSGYPWWPAKVADKDSIKSNKILKKAKNKDSQILVKYFGSETYGWFNDKDVFLFEKHFEEKSKPAGKSKTVSKSLQAAIDEAKAAIKEEAPAPKTEVVNDKPATEEKADEKKEATGKSSSKRKAPPKKAKAAAPAPATKKAKTEA